MARSLVSPQKAQQFLVRLLASLLAHEVPHKVVIRHPKTPQAPVHDTQGSLKCLMPKHVFGKSSADPAVQSGLVHHIGSVGPKIIPEAQKHITSPKRHVRQTVGSLLTKNTQL